MDAGVLSGLADCDAFAVICCNLPKIVLDCPLVESAAKPEPTPGPDEPTSISECECERTPRERLPFDEDDADESDMEIDGGP